jgi:hypothetical protein
MPTLKTPPGASFVSTTDPGASFFAARFFDGCFLRKEVLRSLRVNRLIDASGDRQRERGGGRRKQQRLRARAHWDKWEGSREETDTPGQLQDHDEGPTTERSARALEHGRRRPGCDSLAERGA